MDDTFKPDSLTIKEIFTMPDYFYQIPRYQRPYKWVDEQVEKLWEDIMTSYENNDKNYFLGSIIVANAANVYHDIVDGQQRLTTLMILFCVYRDLFPDINSELTEADPTVVDIQILKDAILFKGRTERLKLNTHSHHQSDFDNLIVKNDNKKHNRKPTKYQINTDEEPKYKFINTALIFKNKLLDLGEDQAGLFLNYLFNKVKIIRIDCSSKEFAIKLFQVLNDRGLDLTAADLIKSFLLEKLMKKYKDDEETQLKKEDQFMDEWKEIENIIKNVDVNLNDMFIIYEYYLLESNPSKSLYEELQIKFDNKDPIEVIKHFKDFVSDYYNKIFYGEDKALYSLWYLRWNFYWKSILLSAYQVNYSNIEGLTIQLRRFYYLYWIAGKTLTQIKQTSFNILKLVKQKKDIDLIKKLIDKKLSEDKIIEDALRSLDDSDIYYSAWCKPLLLLLEYNSEDKSKNSFIEWKRDLHVEHILPIKYNNFKEWSHIKEKFADKWINSAGNLTLLSGSKNIEASDNPFKTKIKVYTGKGLYDDKNEKISAFNITKKIVDDYNLGKKEWNEEAICDRWNWFCDEVNEILNIDTSKIKHTK